MALFAVTVGFARRGAHAILAELIHTSSTRLAAWIVATVRRIGDGLASAIDATFALYTITHRLTCSGRVRAGTRLVLLVAAGLTCGTLLCVVTTIHRLGASNALGADAIES